MPSPFPGIDPYIEPSGYWPDFHTSIILSIRRILLGRLPAGYDATIEQRLELRDWDLDSPRPRISDVSVVETDNWRPDNASPAAGADAATATLPVLLEAIDELPRRYVAVRDERSVVVTVIEVLSPTNKRGDGALAFRQKAAEVTLGGSHLVVADFLLRGRFPLHMELPPGDGRVAVIRADRPRAGAVWSFGLRDRLPRVPVPLRGDDGVTLDLGEAYARVYEDDGFDRRIRYDVPVPAAVPRVHADWVRERAAAAAG